MSCSYKKDMTNLNALGINNVSLFIKYYKTPFSNAENCCRTFPRIKRTNMLSLVI